MKAAHITLISSLLSLAVVLGIIESIYIPQIIPGLKLGITNIITIFGVYILKKRIIFIIMILRVILVSLLLGKIFSIGFFISISGALLSTITIFFIHSLNHDITPTFLSIIGAIFHNIGQLISAYFFIGLGFFYYLPYFILFAIPTGYTIGKISTGILHKGIQKIFTQEEIL